MTEMADDVSIDDKANKTLYIASVYFFTFSVDFNRFLPKSLDLTERLLSGKKICEYIFYRDPC